MDLPQQRERVNVDGLRNIGNIKAKETVAKATTTTEKGVENPTESSIIETETKEFMRIETPTSEALKSRNIEYNQVLNHTKPLTDNDIINAVSGGDMTVDSCASVALAYVGQKQGWSVLDFRGGDSRSYFSSKMNKVKMFNDLGANTIVANSARTSLTNGKEILKQLNENKEYYLSVGRHVAIVRNKNGIMQYLELQSGNPKLNGWRDFGNIAYTLKHRFRCSSSSKYFATEYATDISQLGGDDLKTILGYINTSIDKQKKGLSGSVK